MESDLEKNKLPGDRHYTRLQQHLDRLPIGFPPSRTGADIRLLKHIFTPEEAKIALCLSHRHAPAKALFARAGHLVDSVPKLEDRLRAMVKKGGIEFRKEKGQRLYANAPLVVGMYELQVDRLTPELIRDFKAYTSEKRYGISLLGTKVPQMRTIPIHKSLSTHMPVADYDQVTRLLDKAAAPFVILPCICRKKAAMLGNDCKQTQRTETCMAMGSFAHSVLEMGIGRKISRNEARDIIGANEKDGLVLQPANTREVEFVCSCCGCCCGMLGIQKDLPLPLDFWASNFKALLDKELCIGCGKCSKICQTGALCLVQPSSIPEIPATDEPKIKPKTSLDARRCIGCGLCVPACPFDAISLEPVSTQTRPPKNREALNETILEGKKSPLGKVRVIGKLARAMLVTRDLRLLKKED